MKKMLLAVTLAFAATAAQADIVTSSFTLGSSAAQAFQSGIAITPSVGDDGWGGNGSTLQPAGLYTQGSFGQLYSNFTGDARFTFLGKVAAFDNQVNELDAADVYVGGVLMDGTAPGSQIDVAVTAGQRIRFGFVDDNGAGPTFANGMANSPTQGIMFFDATAWNEIYGTSFEFLIGYNDTANVNADYDDYVIGVSQVPVPAALPLMASALGMFGVARRRKTLA